MLFATPVLDEDDLRVLAEVSAMREKMAAYLRVPRRWAGSLRRNAEARAVRGSNSIEGINVELDDADAALDGDEPLSADARAFTEVQGYRRALSYILNAAADDHFALDVSTLRSLHFMMLGHDLAKWPGRFRPGAIYVRDERTEEIVYEGAEADEVPALVEELMVDLRQDASDPLVSGAMAHLNLTMIHPFRDGNGRMARALQTLVLTRSGMAEPIFSSIEEWLGDNTEDYYAALAVTGRGRWQPGNDAHLWVKFVLRAHHLQAQLMHRRIKRTEAVYAELQGQLERAGLHERSLDALYAALVGYRIRRSAYVRETQVDERTASRDLRALVDAGYLEARGETKGRHYVRAGKLIDIRRELSDVVPISDPSPELLAEIRRVR